MKYLKKLNAVAFTLLLLSTSSRFAYAQGRDITPADWADRLPVLFIAIIVVLFVDYLFIRQIRKNNTEDDRSIWERKDV